MIKEIEASKNHESSVTPKQLKAIKVKLTGNQSPPHKKKLTRRRGRQRTDIRTEERRY